MTSNLHIVTNSYFQNSKFSQKYSQKLPKSSLIFGKNSQNFGKHFYVIWLIVRHICYFFADTKSIMKIGKVSVKVSKKYQKSIEKVSDLLKYYFSYLSNSITFLQKQKMCTNIYHQNIKYFSGFF